MIPLRMYQIWNELNFPAESYINMAYLNPRGIGRWNTDTKLMQDPKIYFIIRNGVDEVLKIARKSIACTVPKLSRLKRNHFITFI